MTWLLLLRGVNVGGKRVAMSDLREMLSGMGFDRPRSLLQSGNLLFEAPSSKPAPLERRIQQQLLKSLQLESEIFVRTVREWNEAIAANPYPDEAASDPAHLVMMCLRAEPTASALDALRAAIVGRERVEVIGRQAYFVYPDGIGRSKLTNAVIERRLGGHGTARNWNTVLKLAAAAADSAG